MKATSPILVEPPLERETVVLESSSIVAEERSAFGIFVDLVKARLTTLVLLTTMVGFYAGASSPVDYRTMVYALRSCAHPDQ